MPPRTSICALVSLTVILLALSGYFIASCVLASESSAKKIKAAAILFRHGERTPLTSVPGLPCSMCEDLGLEQLTEAGTRQMYDNGVQLRVKYNHLLRSDGRFRSSNMRTLSSDTSRAVMSLQSFMAGFLPPDPLDKTLPLRWQPFNLETDSAGRVLTLNFKSCPLFTKHVNHYMRTPPTDFANWMRADRQAIERISEHLGSPIKTPFDLFRVSDSLGILQNESTPQWISETYNKTFKKYSRRFIQLMHSNEEMIKSRGGPLLTEIVHNMERLANNSEDSPGKKLLIYSAHDFTISSLAYVLGVQEQIPDQIGYSATIVLDLVDRDSGELCVEAIFSDNNAEIPTKISLDVPGCGSSCLVYTFKNAVKDMLIEDFDKFCEV